MYLVAFVSAGSKEEAEKIASGLLKEKLAACVNIVKGADSHFWWQGKLDKAKETLLIVKTKKSLFPGLIKKIKSMHSYEVPEIIALPVVAGHKPYLDWIDESTK
ncbi:divalent-cation tolerance protein CutA [bacterium]|nr:MAG: divalent-cation tolerance protein CutA [bacterium]